MENLKFQIFWLFFLHLIWYFQGVPSTRQSVGFGSEVVQDGSNSRDSSNHFIGAQKKNTRKSKRKKKPIGGFTDEQADDFGLDPELIDEDEARGASPDTYTKTLIERESHMTVARQFGKFDIRKFMELISRNFWNFLQVLMLWIKYCPSGYRSWNRLEEISSRIIYNMQECRGAIKSLKWPIIPIWQTKKMFLT